MIQFCTWKETPITTAKHQMKFKNFQLQQDLTYFGLCALQQNSWCVKQLEPVSLAFFRNIMMFNAIKIMLHKAWKISIVFLIAILKLKLRISLIRISRITAACIVFHHIPYSRADGAFPMGY